MSAESIERFLVKWGGTRKQQETTMVALRVRGIEPSVLSLGQLTNREWETAAPLLQEAIRRSLRSSKRILRRR